MAIWKDLESETPKTTVSSVITAKIHTKKKITDL
jgi:hypothetical protein